MTPKETNHAVARCLCGQVEYQLNGTPILSSVCHCDDCQEASRQLESLPEAPPILDRAFGTPYVLYRKDRVTCVKGSPLLREFRIEQEKGTKRLVAGCCNSPMLLDFEAGHWVSFFRDRLEDPRPRIQMRIQTKYVPQGVEIPPDVAQAPGFSAGFIARLLAARIAMLFTRSPKDHP